MKIFHSVTSPFVRKVMAVAIELGVDQDIERLPSDVHPIRVDSTVAGHNPLGQVPTFFTADGTILYDSRVICEYLDTTYGQGRLFPADPAVRWVALRDQALADGMLTAGVLVRYELTIRDPALQNADWLAGQRRKLLEGVRQLESTFEHWAERFDIGTIAIACALGYLDFRFADLGWREIGPRTAQWQDQICERPSLATTRPV
ncbi:glutathione S-transferase N-terminal domain-containing protein [Castellaniella sp.]|uniref:glutathione S-transferase N-terminal domain-containing protein n=1 Tax=Castellaniella sp. TaxID=1955812 RepID=UPI003561B288